MGASYAVVAVHDFQKGIAVYVHSVAGQGYHALGTRYHAQPASLAAVCVYGDSAMYLTHMLY